MRFWALLFYSLVFGVALAGQSAPSASVSVPHVIRYAGNVPITIPAGRWQISVTFRLFASSKGGSALWQETQNLPVQEGKFTALIGASTADGIPLYWFATTQARWLEVQVEGENAQPRVQLATVPYAMKAASADRFAGRPITDFVLRSEATSNNTVMASLGTATLGPNSFVGDQLVNGNVTATGGVTAASAIMTSAQVVNQLLWVKSTATTGGVISIKAENASSGGTAIAGVVSSTSGNTIGVQGRTESVVGIAVSGLANAITGSAEAISGTARAPQGHGVGGYATNTTGANVGVLGKSISSQGTGVVGEASPATNGSTTYGVVGKTHGYPGIALYGFADAPTGSTVGIQANVLSAAGTAGYFVNASSGNILIGEAGTKNVFRVDGTGKVFADGGVQSSGADFAESIAVRGSRAAYEPGDVLVIDEAADRQISLASEPYSTGVAGVYSTKPGTLSSPHEITADLSAEVPMAVIGIVPCKVTTSNGPIHRGDSLVTSSLPGYAMKGTDRARFVGAIVGKALQDLSEGTGVIEILVTLQ